VNEIKPIIHAETTQCKYEQYDTEEMLSLTIKQCGTLDTTFLSFLLLHIVVFREHTDGHDP